MDVDWVCRKLEEFIELCDSSLELRPRGDLMSELRRREATVGVILSSLAPVSLAKRFSLDWPDDGGVPPEYEAKAVAERCLGLALDRGEWAIRLAPDSPTLPADSFHPWVWDSARTLWSSQHFRQAVQAAATSINAKLQQKVGRRDLSDTKLIQDVFGDRAPEPGKSRLRLPGDQTDESIQSRQRGALQLGLGCVSAIRNPASHDDEEWEEQIALERLATLSVFARLIDECEVVTA